MMAAISYSVAAGFAVGLLVACVLITYNDLDDGP